MRRPDALLFQSCYFLPVTGGSGRVPQKAPIAQMKLQCSFLLFHLQRLLNQKNLHFLVFWKGPVAFEIEHFLYALRRCFMEGRSRGHHSEH